MSFLIPPTTSFMTPLGGFGKPAYLPPEVFHNLPFDAYACDLWSSIVILFNLLTGEILYRQPSPSDIGFRYFVLAGGISKTPVNERTVEVLMDLEGADQMALWKIASRCLHLSPEVLEILDQVLRVAMQERWTTDEISVSAFMNPH
jgi:serine/threonine protein kinase